MPKVSTSVPYDMGGSVKLGVDEMIVQIVDSVFEESGVGVKIDDGWASAVMVRFTCCHGLSGWTAQNDADEFYDFHLVGAAAGHNAKVIKEDGRLTPGDF